MIEYFSLIIINIKLEPSISDHAVIDEQQILEQIQLDAKNLERLAERSYCKDCCRLGLGSLSTSQSRARIDPFRLTLVNIDYSVCERFEFSEIITVPLQSLV